MKVLIRQLARLVALAAGMAWQTIYAQDAMESVLVTGSYAPQPEITASVSVLDRAQIQALNKRTLADLLKTVPGLLVEEQGGPGGLTAVSIRGAEANFTLVMLDGVPLNDPTNSRGGGFDLGKISGNLIERIEVVRGAQSAVYGSDALAGVINIISRRPEAGHRQQLNARWGEHDYRDISLSALGSSGRFDYVVELGSRDDGEPVSGSSRDSEKLNMRLGWQPVEGQRLTLAYHYLDGDRDSYPEESGGGLYAVSDELDAGDYRDEVFALGWEARLLPRWRSTLTASRFEHEENFISPGIAPYTEVPPNGAETDYRSDRLQWVNSVQVGANALLNLGADYHDEQGDSDGYLDFGFELPTDFFLDRSTVGAFADLSFKPVEGLLLQGALRFDDLEGFNDEVSAHLGAAYEISSGWSLAGNWGRAFKLPSFFALGHALVGNSALQPETSDSWDLGVAWQPGEIISLAATYFHNDFEDLITFDSQLFTNVNRDRVETSGVELDAVWQPSANFSVSGQATYTDIDVKDSDNPLTGRPDWTAGLLALWRFNEEIQMSLDYRYTGEQYAASRHTGASVTTQLDSYHRVDWALQWDVSEAIQLHLSLDNLLDEDYQSAVGFPGPGRAVRVGVGISHR